MTDDYAHLRDLLVRAVARVRPRHLESHREEIVQEALRRWARRLAVAAAVVVVALVPIGIHEWRAPRAPVYREEGRSALRSLVPESAPLPRERFLLRWTPGPRGTRYVLRVARRDLTVVASASALGDAEFLVPAESLADLPSGERLYWSVRANLPDGGQVVSETFVVRVE